MNENLISKSIMYLSDFLSEEKSVLDYSSFLVRWNLTSSDITPIQYVNIKMAIRRYDCPSINSKSIELLEATINITFISSRNILPSKLFREAIRPPGNAEDLAPLKDWKRILGRYRMKIEKRGVGRPLLGPAKNSRRKSLKVNPNITV